MITSGGSPFRWEGENRPVEGDVGRIMRRASSAALALVAGLLALGGGQVIASHPGTVVRVDGSDTTSDAGGCGNGANPCNTIQAGIDHANPGDTVRVAAGTYAEQVTIGAGKNGLSLASASPLGATIQAPSTALAAPGAIVHIAGATGVTIRGFKVSGPGPSPGSLAAGIYVSNGGSAIIRDNRITAIRDDPVSGNQNGHGILVGGTGQSAPNLTTTGSATIRNNTIDDYQKHGIVVENVGSSADIVGNTVTGQGPTTAIAQHGIRIADGASGRIVDNTVSGNFFTPVPFDSTGLKARGTAAGVTIIGNRSLANQVGIHMEGASNASVSDNHASNNVLGILLASSSANIAKDNKIGGSTNAGVVVVASSNNNTLKDNEIENSGSVGIFVSGSGGNKFIDNEIGNSGTTDAVDQTSGSGTAGTANTWKDNKCETSSPLGLCSP